MAVLSTDLHDDDHHDHHHYDANGGEVIIGSEAEQTTDHTALLYYLDNNSLRWNAMAEIGTQAVITYSFIETADLPNVASDPFGATDYWSYDVNQRFLFEQVIEQYEAVSGVLFVEVQGDAMINIFGTSGSDVGGWANVAWSNASYTGSGQLTNAYQSMSAGSYGYQVNLHELGHALGLQHPHEGSIVLTDEADTQANTVMTYNIESPYATDLGTLDIAAMQEIYGTADSLDGWIVSADATDTVTIQASTRAETILATDQDTIIFAGNGSDTVMGREGDDVVHGGFGNDVITGGLGSDTLYGDNGADTLIGGINTGEFSGDTSERDVLYGGGGKDRLYGGNGVDKLLGGGNNDLMVGGAGNDILRGSVGHDTFMGGQGDDIMFGGGGADVFVFSEDDAFGTDQIHTFQRALDVLDVSPLGFTSMDELTITQEGGNTMISYDNWFSWFDVVLVGFDLPLSEDNFAFA